MKQERDASRTPIYQTIFVWEEAGGWGGDDTGFMGLENAADGEGMDPDDAPVVAKLEIELTLTDQDERGKMSGSIIFNSDMYEVTSIQRIARHFATLVKQFAEVQHMHTHYIHF